ncbi:DUF1206 domain-containing protein [Calidifontibacter sp. DB0510]|uniref:DUF1206 domain-containing protein n=1 Tax=Metallococcus carri TaxID=1656884 RepID=A0A967E955_9MICO|nr:DUF1206 domain-containing protein [Metallococcus carri]NHN55997.1 DUF1206 domain-containing protein [Metallococcus carri]NOP37546.1 DUF1206 domain-containing protein [Calidifontibacter sp. DB2511S]
MDTPDVEGTARRVGDSRVIEYGARTGFAASGVLHLVMALIALRIAWSKGGGSADQSGALGDLASHPGGRVLLWVVVVGMALLALWHLTEAITGEPGADSKDRLFDAVTDVAKTVMFAGLAWAAAKFAMGGGSSSSGSTRDFTSRLMQQPFGRALVVVVGLVIIGIGGYHVYKGWTQGFRDDLREHPGSAVMALGRIGFIAKGIALAIVGVLFVVGGAKSTTKDTTGLDGALRTLLEQPFGKLLLTLVAIGIACYGVYSLALSKFARV